MGPSLTRRRLLAAGAAAVAGTGFAGIGYSRLRTRDVWTVEIGSDPSPRFPRFADGRLLVVADRQVIVLDAEEGDVRRAWPSPLAVSRAIDYPPVIADSEVYVGTDLGVFAYGLDAETPRWEFEHDEREGTAVAVGDESVFAAARSVLYRLDRSDGARRWKRDLPGRVTGPPAYDAGVVYVPTEGAVRAIADDGETAWTAPVDGPSEVTVAGNDVVITDVYGARVVDAATGERRWRARTSTVGPPAVADGRVFTGGGRGTAHALRLSDGEQTWYARFGGGSPRIGPPLYRDGTVYFASHDGIHSVDAASGERRWHHAMTGLGYPLGLAMGDGRLYVTNDGGVHAVSLRPRLPI